MPDTDVSAAAPMPAAVPDLAEKMRTLAREFAAYRRELPRLLAEGEAGRFAVVAGDELLGTWDTLRDALQFGYGRLGPDAPFLVHQVSTRDPELFARMRLA